MTPYPQTTVVRFFPLPRLSGFGNPGSCVCYTPPGRLFFGFVSSLGFPDLETGSCRGVLSSVSLFPPPLGFPDLETGSCRGGSANVSLFCFLSAFRIWKQVGNRFVCYTQGGVDPLNFVIDIAPSRSLCNQSFWFPRLSGLGNRVLCLLYTGGVDSVNIVIYNFPPRFSSTDYRIWKQCGELDLMNCRRACISRCLPNVIFVNDGRHVTLSEVLGPKHWGDSAIYVGSRPPSRHLEPPLSVAPPPSQHLEPPLSVGEVGRLNPYHGEDFPLCFTARPRVGGRRAAGRIFG